MENTWENTPFRKLLRLVLFCQGSETGFTQSLEKRTRKVLLHKPTFLEVGKSLPTCLARTLGQRFSHDPEFSEENGYLSFTLLSSLWRLWIMCQEWRRAGVTGASLDQADSKIASLFWFRSLPWGCARNMLIFPVFADAASPLTTNPHSLPRPHHWNTASKPLEIWERTWKSLA